MGEQLPSFHTTKQERFAKCKINITPLLIYIFFLSWKIQLFCIKKKLI